MKKNPKIIPIPPQVSPSNWSPTKPGDFIGAAGEVAGVLDLKAEKLLLSEQALRVVFYGPPGCGKTALAKWLAGRLAGHSSNIEQLNGKQIGIEVARRWMGSLAMGSLFGYSVKLVNELDACSPDAQVLLLEYADELRGGCAFIGTSNLDLHRMQERFQTRWMQYHITNPPQEEIAGLVRRFGVDPEQADKIAFGAGGNVRAALLDAEAHLDVVAYRNLKAA